jgi:hypothetical protein
MCFAMCFVMCFAQTRIRFFGWRGVEWEAKPVETMAAADAFEDRHGPVLR